MHIAFITVGDTQRLTGGYLYHARLFAGLRTWGITVNELVPSAANIADQAAAAVAFGRSFNPDPFDVIVIDALARGVCAPWIDQWRGLRPVVVLVHELPSVATASRDTSEEAREAALLRADRLIAVSAHGKAILEARGVPTNRIAIVSPGYDRLGAAPPLPPSLAQPAPDSPVLRALCVAQWIPRKDIGTLISAWNSQPRPNAQLELIGETNADPEYTATLRALLAATPTANISVRGPVDDTTLAAAYASADLFVLPSRYEGYGMVYAEALDYGLPIIACAVGPVPDLVTEAAGIFVPPGDANALATALSQLLGDAGLRSHLAQGARQRASTLPSWNDTVAGFCHVLETVRGSA